MADTGGSVFPITEPGRFVGDPGYVSDYGLTRRDWFATYAPSPTNEEITQELDKDKLANPHGDSYKPRRRGKLEIITELRYKYADAMIAASKRNPR